MAKLVPIGAACLLAALLGASFAWRLARKAPDLPDGPGVVLKVRERARLETLDVTLYKKIAFAPDPQPKTDLWSGVAQWARYTLRQPQGRAIIFARAHLGVDLSHLDARSLRISGRRVELVLPRPSVSVELLPGETEVIGSNLDSRETAQLFDLARVAFAQEVEGDAGLRERAAESARRTLRALLFGIGFSEVAFVDSLSSGTVD